MRLLIFLFSLLLISTNASADRSEQLVSPNGKVRLEIKVSNELSFSAYYADELMLKDCAVNVVVDGKTLGANPKLRSQKRSLMNERIQNVVPLKQATTLDKAQVLTLRFAGQYGVEFRAYDNGYAYRFLLEQKGTVNVQNEGMTLRFPAPFTAHLAKTRSFWSSYESTYTHVSTTDYKGSDEMCYLPALLESPKGTKLLISESDVQDYPAMFLKSTGTNGLSSIFPKAPLEWEQVGDRGFGITKEANYIARTSGKRALPWRFGVLGSDADIALNEMERVLGGKNQLSDVSWIRPGKVIWDWWNHWTVWNVDFEVGINTTTYKYFIDFAARYGLDYILLDEGWNRDVNRPFDVIDNIDVQELVDYGRKKGVGVILWMTWLAVEKNMNVIEHYAKMGVKGLKVDFMDHSDQWMVNFYERVAKECAKHHLLVDFHGSFKPAGLEIRYPNVISYEGVRGMEYGDGCQPVNSIWYPFMRNAVGAMDFTPGSMASAQPEDNRGTGSLPMGSGTRAYQMALYVCFESGLQMLADSPTRYMREDECARFIASVPTTWDETRVLAAKAGEYYVVAKRKGTKWFVGAITGNNPQTINVQFDFLKQPGRLTSFEDGRNANRIAVDYRCRQQTVDSRMLHTLRLARNGGWCGVIE
jgi:alpha-glucosidase